MKTRSISIVAPSNRPLWICVLRLPSRASEQPRRSSSSGTSTVFFTPKRLRVMSGAPSPAESHVLPATARLRSNDVQRQTAPLISVTVNNSATQHGARLARNAAPNPFPFTNVRICFTVNWHAGTRRRGGKIHHEEHEGAQRSDCAPYGAQSAFVIFVVIYAASPHAILLEAQRDEGDFLQGPQLVHELFEVERIRLKAHPEKVRHVADEGTAGRWRGVEHQLLVLRRRGVEGIAVHRVVRIDRRRQRLEVEIERLRKVETADRFETQRLQTAAGVTAPVPLQRVGGRRSVRRSYERARDAVVVVIVKQERAEVPGRGEEQPLDLLQFVIIAAVTESVAQQLVREVPFPQRVRPIGHAHFAARLVGLH